MTLVKRNKFFWEPKMLLVNAFFLELLYGNALEYFDATMWFLLNNSIEPISFSKVGKLIHLDLEFSLLYLADLSNTALILIGAFPTRALCIHIKYLYV
jgi:hypothetical protein